MQSNTNVLAHITAFTVAMIWGSTFISTKVLILNGLSPVQIFTLRFIVAYLLLLLMSLYLGRHDKRKFSWIADNWKAKSVPAEIKKDVPADEADNIRKQLVEAGATVEYK